MLHRGLAPSRSPTHHRRANYYVDLLLGTQVLGTRSLGTHSANHPFPHLLGTLLDFPEGREFGHYGLHDLATLFDVSQLTPAKHKRDLHFVFLLQEADRLFHLEIDVVLTGFGAETNLFDSGVMGVLVGLLFLFVFVLAVVHDPADRWSLVWRHLNEIKALLARLGNCLCGCDNSQLFASGADYAYGRDANLFIHTCGNAVDS